MAITLLVMTLGVALGAVAPADGHAQVPSQQQPAAPAATLSFSADAALIINLVRESSVADFDMVISRLKEALAKSENPIRQRQAESWKVYKATAPSQTTCPDGTACSALVYIFVFDPVIKGAEYDPIKILAEAYPTEVFALYEKLKAAYVRFDPLSLTSLGPMSGVK